MSKAKKIGNGWYTDDAEYVVTRTIRAKVVRGDGSYVEFAGGGGRSSFQVAMRVAEALAKGEQNDSDYDWIGGKKDEKRT